MGGGRRAALDWLVQADVLILLEFSLVRRALDGHLVCVQSASKQFVRLLSWRCPLAAEYDVIGPWTEVKLDILREYAGPYSQIVTAYGFHHLHINAYAAGGSHFSRTTGDVAPGSSLVALSTKR